MSLRKGMVIVVAVTILGSLFGTPHMVWAKDEPSAEAITLDFVLIRPVGVLSLAAGTGIFIISSPLALITGSTKTSAKKLVVEPFTFTFVRPLGEY
ncbi:MAG: hypothetical protein JRI46_00345 [Deltaproteobacteria bacterium]|nr:hypothetical protein [Deltaproteobacteria bacterium]